MTRFLCTLSIAALLWVGCAPQISVDLIGSPLVSSAQKDIFEKIAKSRSEIHSFKGLYRVQVQHNEEKQTFRYAIVYKEPAALRIQIFPLNGFYSLGEFISTKNEVIALDHAQKRVLAGGTERELLEELLGLPLTKDELIDFILGKPSQISVDVDQAATKEDKMYVMHARESSFERWTFLADSLAAKEVRRVQKEGGSQHGVIVEYTASSSTKNSIPQQFKIIIPSYEVSAEVKCTHSELNPEVKDSEFTLEVPSDYN